MNALKGRKQINIMAQSLSGVYVHITFSTKHRHPFIDDDIGTRLFEYISGICKNLECNPIVIGGHKDHIHILCLLSRKISQSKLLEEIKKNSSKWIKSVDTKYKNFYWQDGFGIFSVNPSEIDIVRDYINNQKERHKKISFQEEYLAFLKKYKIEYDERYLWD